MAFTVVTVTRDYTLANGLAPVGRVHFTPAVPMVNDATIVAAPVVAQLDANGSLSIPLAANTDLGTNPGDSYYIVREEITGQPRQQYSVRIPHDAGSVLDLSALATIASAPALSFPDRLGTAVSVDGVHVPSYDISSAAVGVGDLAGVDEANAAVGGVLTAAAVTGPGTPGALVTGWSVVNPPPARPVPSNAAGRYLWPVSAAAASTSAALTNGTLRLAPWELLVPITIDRLGAEIVTGTTGDVGSKLRLGAYLDNGNAYPGALLLDAGQIAGDSIAVQDLTVSKVIPAGIIWVGGALQSVVTTQPTVRITNNPDLPVMLVGPNTIPGAGATSVGYAMTGVTGALPANFSTTIVPTGSAPRCHVRVV